MTLSNFPPVDGATLRAIREYFGMTIEEVSLSMGFQSKSTVSKLETGNKRIKPDLMNCFFKLLNDRKGFTDEDELIELINQFKKNTKLESKLLEVNVRNTSKPLTEIDKADLSFNQIIQNLLDEKKESLKQNFENLQIINEIKYSLEKSENTQKQRFDLLQERFRDLSSQFDNLKNHEIQNYISSEYFKIKADVMDYIQSMIKDEPEDKESGLSGLIEKVNSSPALASFVSSIGSKAGETIGDFVSKIFTKLTNSPIFDGKLDMNQATFANKSPFPQPIQSDSGRENNDYSENLNDNSDVSNENYSNNANYEKVPNVPRARKSK